MERRPGCTRDELQTSPGGRPGVATGPKETSKCWQFDSLVGWESGRVITLTFFRLNGKISRSILGEPFGIRVVKEILPKPFLKGMNTMTDLEEFKQLFDRVGLAPLTLIYLNEESKVVNVLQLNAQRNPKVCGYSGFIAGFEFGEDDKFLRTVIYE